MSVEDSPTSTTNDVNVDAAAEDLSKSALADNIEKKGKNAYYYAHSHKATGPKWDGKIEPRLLSTSSTTSSNNDVGDATAVNNSITASATSSNKAALMAKSNITNYAFLNEETKVKIYVNLPGVGECCADENIALDYTERTLCLTVKDYVTPVEKEKVEVDELIADTAPEEEDKVEEEKKKGEDRCLSFGQLFGEIEKATFRKKADKIILTLKKKDEKVWSRVIA